MAKWFTILKSLIPKSRKLNFFPGSNLEKLLNALAVEYARLEAETIGVVAESIPSTTDQLLPEWTDIYRISPDLTDQEIKDIAISYYTGTGNQAENYILEQLQVAFPDAKIETIYQGSGTIGLMEIGSPAAVIGGQGSIVYVYATVTDDQEAELQRLIDYYFPRHLGVVTQFTRPQVNNPGAAIPFSVGYDGLGKTTGTDAP